MSCSILTAPRLEALLAGRLDAEARAELSAHLQSPCELCLERLSSVDAEALLLALSGAQAQLTPEEQRTMLEGALTRAERPRRAAPAPPGSWIDRLLGFFAAGSWRPAVAVSSVALIALGVPLLLEWQQGPVSRLESPAAWDGVKGSEQPLLLTLSAFAAPALSQELAPRSLSSPATLAADEVVLLRFGLSRPAFLYLFAQGERGTEVLWQPDPGDAPWPPGERELASGGKALAFLPSRLGSKVSLLAIATPSQQPALVSANVANPAEVQRLCPSCATRELLVLVR